MLTYLHMAGGPCCYSPGENTLVFVLQTRVRSRIKGGLTQGIEYVLYIAGRMCGST